MTTSLGEAKGGHTSGPWVVSKSSTGRRVTSIKGVIICNAVIRNSGSAKNGHKHGAKESLEAEANARLIAAAPDLLNAASRLMVVFDQQKMTAAERIIVGVSDSGLRTEGNAAIEALRAAISQATSNLTGEKGK